MNLFDIIATFSRILPYILDGLIVVMLLVAIIIGGRRTYRQSLAVLLVQLVSLIVALLIGNWLSIKTTEFMLDRLNFAALIPERFSLTVEPLLGSLLNPFMFLMLGAIIFALVKSIIGGLTLEKKLFPNWRLARTQNLLLSIFFSVLNMYSHLLVVIVIFAFPLFNIVGEDTLSAKILKMTPIVSSRVEQMYSPFVALQDAMQLLNLGLGEFTSLEDTNLEEIADLVAENPEMINQVIALIPDETMVEVNEKLKENGLTQTDAIDEVQRRLNEGELTVEEIQSMIEAYLP